MFLYFIKQRLFSYFQHYDLGFELFHDHLLPQRISGACRAVVAVTADPASAFVNTDGGHRAADSRLPRLAERQLHPWMG
jgi:hypothetical protein